MGHSELLTHNSLYFRKRKELGKRLLSPRDLGSQFYPAVSGSALSFPDKNLTLVISSNERPTGVGSIEHGSIDIGLGRKNRFDDDKGLPDGVQDNNPYSLTFTLSLDMNDI